ncbi:hypothetical protein O7626_11595 [Micromonospora sp. WMMD1102]|uniref:hypothetical protein n=1 Tax=Micromonospora sp. WMMD1102 TaxID=3016105 RepID=UPI002414E545|nr:hypothetical protein [Micromonospora sp. WMMD1102]MDG4786565.1 hypothetical protein [Micromonospora sp. WMMD1102]
MTVRGADGLVEATLDPAGALVGLRLDERTRQQPADRVAEEILATVRAARAELLRKVTEATVELLGADDPGGQALLNSYGGGRLTAP